VILSTVPMLATRVDRHERYLNG